MKIVDYLDINANCLIESANSFQTFSVAMRRT